MPIDFDDLRDALDLAYRDATEGKGFTRHGGGGVPFNEQWIIWGGRHFGWRALLYQACKKLTEVPVRYDKEDAGAAIHEIAGAINYAAAAIIHLKRGTRK